MNTKTFVLSSLLALALAATSAHAQSIASIGSLNSEADGDLLLGFTSSTASSDLVFDLGQSTLFGTAANGGTLTPGSTYTVAAFDSNAVTDLTTAVTSLGFNSSTQWAVLGGNSNATNNPVWITNSTGAHLTTNNNQAANAGSLDTLAGETSNSGGGTLVSSVDGIFGSKDFYSQSSTNVGSTYPNVSQAVGSSGSTSLVLWQLAGTSSGSAAGVDLGTFTLNASTHVLTFTAYQAIPEPSTYAAILGALTVGFVLVRRRSRAGAAAAFLA